MVVKVYAVCITLNVTLEFVWQRRYSVLMMRMDLGSRGPWGYHEQFNLKLPKTFCNAALPWMDSLLLEQALPEIFLGHSS